MKRNISNLAIFSKMSMFNSVHPSANFVKPNNAKLFSLIHPSELLYAKNVQKVEKELANLHNVKYVIATCNGFWAIALCIQYFALKGKREIILPSFSYIRMIDNVHICNFNIHFCEVEFKNCTMTQETIIPCINNNTALIIGMHPMVSLIDINELQIVSKTYNIPLIFDSVGGSYASYQGKMLGSFGEAECFSMHASKLLNGFEGGYITTNNEEFYETLKHPKFPSYYDFDWKLNELHAATALVSLQDLPNQIKRNKERYETYKTHLATIKGIDLIKYDKSEKRSYINILIHLNQDWLISRDETVKILQAEKIMCRPYYNIPLHKKIKGTQDTISQDMSLTKELSNRFILLPAGDFTSNEDIVKICEFLQFLQQHGSEIQQRLHPR